MRPCRRSLEMLFDVTENGADRTGGGNVWQHEASATDAMDVLRRQHPTASGCTSSADDAAHLVSRPDRGHRLIVLGATCVAHSDLVSDATGRALSGRQITWWNPVYSCLEWPLYRTSSHPEPAPRCKDVRRDEKG